jgi:hypothetical protein
MPRTTNIQITSAFGQIQKQARQLLIKLRSEIHSIEADLRRLKEDESTLAALTAQRGISSSNRGRRT